MLVGHSKFLSTPSARRAPRLAVLHPARSGISIHALREEGDLLYFDVLPCGKVFLSTPSARRATLSFLQSLKRYSHFYPRPPRGGRPSKAGGRQRLFDISIHALREEGDSKLEPISSLFSYFYPRPPRGGRPRRSQRRTKSPEISIHALREEGDFFSRISGFLRQIISIHALREEGDYSPSGRSAVAPAFLSTPSARRATWGLSFSASASARFLSTPSARRATLSQRLRVVNFRFLSTPSARRATPPNKNVLVV